METNDIVNNTQDSRFEIAEEDEVAYLEYNIQPDWIILRHTYVPAEIEGRGLGGRLARAGLEYARENKLKVIPQCAFVRSYLGRHPEYNDLLDGDL
jgi:uncharacterized protein